MSKKNKVVIKIEMPTQEEIYSQIRKVPVPPTQQHRPKKGKGSYRRKGKHQRKEE